MVDNYQGKRLNSPNDLVYHSSGDLYFTDPPYGLPQQFDDPLRELDFCGVYRLKPDGTVDAADQRAVGTQRRGPFARRKDAVRGEFRSRQGDLDGLRRAQGRHAWARGGVFFDATPWVVEKRPGLPDGLKTDKTGHIFASGPGGIHIFTPAGKRLGTLNIGEAISNCGWGNDGSVLYITADTYLCRVKTSTKGAGW